MPALPSSRSQSAFFGMSRWIRSSSCVCQFQPAALRMCPCSYADVSTSTSTRRTFGSLRCSATHAVDTNAALFAYPSPLAIPYLLRHELSPRSLESLKLERPSTLQLQFTHHSIDN